MSSRFHSKILASSPSLLRVLNFWPLGLFWLLVASIDLNYRFLGNVESGIATEVRSEAQGSVYIEVLSDERHEFYLSKLSKLAGSEPSESINVVPDSEAALEPPVPGVWANKDFKFKLMAIFDSGSKFAVLTRLDKKSGEKQIVEARVGDDLGEVVVIEIVGKTLILSSPGSQLIELELYRPRLDWSGRNNNGDASI
ncbi:MAG: Uncharacterised protein [Porticoccaceae bacterium UBA1117]|nr:MAG: Uncharacterised protein [Porticoccaceae bacterium UBA1117]